MGSKFFNLNIYGGTMEQAVAAAPRYSYHLCANQWLTVTSDAFEWGSTRKAAKKLSSLLSLPVLSTEYFDDDYAEFTLYCGGKKAAHHVPAEYEGFPRSPGKSKAWAEQLGLSREAEKTLRIVFKETSPEASLRLLECVLGCPLWVDAESADSAEAPTRTYLTEYLERKSAEKKIRNQTKLVLLEELQGDFGWRLTYPMVCREHRGRLKTFWDIREGHFHRLFQTEIPGQADDCRAQARGEGLSLLSFHEFSTGKNNTTSYVFSDKGEVLETFCGGKQILLKGAFLDQDRVFLEGGCWNIRIHKKEWDLGLGNTYNGVTPPRVLADGRLAIVYDQAGHPLDGFISTFRPDGSDVITKKLPDFRHWSYPLIHGSELYLGCNTRIICYDAQLEEKWSVDLGENVGQLGNPHLDVVSKMLYMSTSQRITAFDIEKRQVTAIREKADGEDCYLHDLLPGTGPIMLTGDSSIQVWNAELTPISRHRAKGAISQVLHMDGRVYLLTNTAEECEYPKTEHGRERVVVKPGCLRLYELSCGGNT